MEKELPHRMFQTQRLENQCDWMSDVDEIFIDIVNSHKPSALSDTHWRTLSLSGGEYQDIEIHQASSIVHKSYIHTHLLISSSFL